MKNLLPFEREFSDLAGEMAMRLSYARSVGQVFGLLYVRPAPLSLDDVAELLGMSKGSVSVTLRVLEGWGAIRKVFVPGSRRAHYAAEEDLAGLAFRRVQEGARARLVWLAQRLRGVEERMGRGAPPSVQARLERLRGLSGRLEKALNALPKLRPFLAAAGLGG